MSRWSRATWAGIASVGLVTFLGSPAMAQSTVHGTGSMSLTWSDNAFNGATDPAPGEPGPVDAWALDLVPGVLFNRLGARTQYTATYTHPVRLYLDIDRPVEQSDIVTLGGSFDVTERDQLMLTFLGSHSRTSDSLRIPGSRAATAPSPTGDVQVVNAAVGETLTHALSETWSLEQTASANHATQVLEDSEDPANYTITTGLGVTHDRPRDTYGLAIDASYLGSTHAGDTDGAEPLHWTWTATARWTHDLAPSWSTQVGLGSAFALRGNRQVLATPTASGTLQHMGEFVSESLTVSRTMAPDALTGFLFLTDTARLDVVAQVAPRAHVSARTSQGYSWNRLVANQTSTQNVGVWVAEAALDWAAIPETLAASVTYQYVRQWSFDDDETALPDFYRNQIMLVVGGQFPRRGIQRFRPSSTGVNASERPIGGSSSALEPAAPPTDTTPPPSSPSP